MTCFGLNANNCNSCSGVLVNGSCLTSPSYISVKLSLEVTSDPSIIILQYNKELLYNIVASISTAFVLSITDSKQQNFTYNITNSQQMIEIKLNFTTYVFPNTPIFMVFDTNEFINLASNTIYVISPTNLKVDSLEFIPYSPAQQNAIASSQAIAQTATTLSQISLDIQIISNPQSATTFLLIQNYELFNVVAYLDIMYPPNVMILFSKMENNAVNVNYLVSVLEDSISSIYTEQPVKAPGKFGLYGMKSNISNNFGGQIFQFFILLMISAIFIIISHISIKLPEGIKKIALRIFYFFVWNFVLSFVISSYFTLIMYTMLHYTTDALQNTHQALSIIILITCTILFLFPGLTGFLTFFNIKKTQDEIKRIPNEKINVILSNFKQNSITTALFPTIHLIRGFIIYVSLI